MRKLFSSIEAITQRLIGSKARPARNNRKQHVRSRLQRIEQLEQRTLLSISPGNLDLLNVKDAMDRFELTGDQVDIGVIAASHAALSEGAKMQEVLGSVAPDATLTAQTATDASGLETAIQALITADVDVIVAAPGLYDQAWFADGAAVTEVLNAVGADILFVSAAGDDGVSTSAGGSIHYQGSYDQSTSPTNFIPFPHDFVGGNEVNGDLLVFDVGPGTVTATMQWDDAWGSPDGDFDLWISGWNGTDWISPVAWRSNNVQPGLPPLEIATATNDGTYSQMAVQVSHYSGLSGGIFEIIVDGPVTAATSAPNGGSIAYDNDNQLFGVAAVEADGAMVVGTVNSGDTSTVAEYSSRGPSNNIGGVRNPLDGVAVDDLTLSVGGNFKGTAAAASFTGGIAALMLELDSTLTPSEIEAALTVTAVDLDSDGNAGTTYDEIGGHGRFDAREALFNVYTPNAPILDSGSDSGFSDSDLLTNDLTPTFTGQVPNDSFVTLLAKGTATGGGWVPVMAGDSDAAGDYSLTVDIPSLVDPWLPIYDGAYEFKVGVSWSDGGVHGDYFNESGVTTVTIDRTGPTADIVDVAPDPRDTVVSEDVVVNFNENVYGLTNGDMTLTLDGGVNLLTGTEGTAPNAATLTTTYSLSDLGGLTADHGTYAVTILASGGLTDEAGNNQGDDRRDGSYGHGQRNSHGVFGGGV
jgi:Big-like domain-containing protein/subtilase family protein